MTHASTAAPRAYGIAPPGYHLPDGIRLGAVRLQVSDLARSLAFYEQVLGLRTLHRVGEGAPSAVLGAQGDARPLVELVERAGARPVPRRGRLGLYHFAILLPDRPSLGRLLAHLASVGAHAGMSDHYVSEAIYLQDPDNLGIEVYADRPRSGWEVRGRELSMTTLPLDVQSVFASAGGKPWTGMPAGTVMGHVHLHVGDLAEAERFYHQGLGLEKVVWSYPGALFLAAGGYHHHLGTNTWAAGAPSAGPDDAALLEWRIELPSTDDVAAAAASLEAVGGTVERDGSDRVARDPWGTRLRLSAPSPLVPSP